MTPYEFRDFIISQQIAPIPKVVALSLWQFANKQTGQCHPSVATLAEHCCCSATAVKSALNELRDFGLIHWEAKRAKFGNSKVNHYHLDGVVWSSRDQTKDQTGDQTPRDHIKDQTNDHMPDQTGVRTADQTGDQSPDDHELGGNRFNKVEEGNNGQVVEIEPEPVPVRPTGDQPKGTVFNLSSFQGLNLEAKPLEPEPEPATDLDGQFEQWWKQYPKKVAKQRAKKAFNSALQSGSASFEDLLAGAMRFAAEREGEDPQYTKHPATWLNGGCWADEPTQAQSAPQGRGGLAGQMENLINERYAHE